jgi:hypothetical protein
MEGVHHINSILMLLLYCKFGKVLRGDIAQRDK